MKSVVCFVVLVVLGEAAKLPSYVKTCRASDPKLDACLMNTVESLRPKLIKGIHKLRIPPIEPFTLPEVEVNRESDQLSVRLRVKDIRAVGASQFIIEKLRTDVANLTMSASITLPTLATQGEFDIDGRLLLVPLKGKGIFKGNFTNIRADVIGKGKVSTVNGVRKLGVLDVKAKIRLLGEADIAFYTVPGPKPSVPLTGAVATFFQENKNDVYDIIYPTLDEAAQEIITRVADSVLGNLDYDDILSEK